MRDEPDIDTISLSQKPRYILPTETVSYSADALDAQLVTHVGHRLRDDSVDGGRGMAGEPFGEVEAGAFEGGYGDGVAGEEVGEDDGVGGLG